MYEVIHTLATHYGWSKREILENVYPHEVPYYLRRIQRDDMQERLIQLSIVHNPHTKDPNHLVTLLKNQLEQREDKSYVEKERMDPESVKVLQELSRHFSFEKSRGFLGE